nr:GntR family transcriptional regulator [Bacillus solitudinis]
MKKGGRSQTSTREFAYQAIKEKILSLELEPATKISEKEISTTLQVSRTPVREAFLKLAQEELLEIFPQSGTIVSRIDLDHVEEARFVREKLETAIVHDACQSFPEEYLFQLESNVATQEIYVKKSNFTRMFELDEEFHKIIFSGCGKSRTWSMIQQMNNHFKRLRMLRLLVSNLDWNIIVSQHKEIVQLITDKNEQKAKEVIKKHLQLVVVEKAILIAQYPNYFK